MDLEAEKDLFEIISQVLLIMVGNRVNKHMNETIKITFL